MKLLPNMHILPDIPFYLYFSSFTHRNQGWLPFFNFEAHASMPDNLLPSMQTSFSSQSSLLLKSELPYMKENVNTHSVTSQWVFCLAVSPVLLKINDTTKDDLAMAYPPLCDSII